MKNTHTFTEKDKTYVTALIYIKDGQQNRFEEYRAKANAILERHNARIEKVIKPTMMAKGGMPLPDEIHFAVFDNQASMHAANNDPDYQQIIDELRTPSVEKLIVIPSKLSDFEFTREVGDKSKTYGVALLNYNEGEKHEKMFEDYHNQVCEIMPEFGTHFERFLIPTGIKGDFKQPIEWEVGRHLMYTSKIVKGAVPLMDVRTIFSVEAAGEDTRAILTFTFNVKEGAPETEVHGFLAKSMADTLLALKHFVETGQPVGISS